MALTVVQQIPSSMVQVQAGGSEHAQSHAATENAREDSDLVVPTSRNCVLFRQAGPVCNNTNTMATSQQHPSRQTKKAKVQIPLRSGSQFQAQKQAKATRLTRAGVRERARQSSKQQQVQPLNFAMNGNIVSQSYDQSARMLADRQQQALVLWGQCQQASAMQAFNGPHANLRGYKQQLQAPDASMPQRPRLELQHQAMPEYG